MKNIYAISALALLLGATSAHAAGYQLNEFSANGLGRSFAGLGVVGDDLSALGYNPAGMTLVKYSGVQAGLALTEIAAKAKSEYGTDKMDYFVPLPSLVGQYNVNDKLFIGAGVYVPYGLSTSYKHDSHAATQSVNGTRKSELEVIDGNLSIAYRFDNGLSLGASGIIRHIEGQLTSNVNKLPGGLYNDFRVKGWSHTYQLGAMYEFNKDSRIGLSYRAKSTQHTHGKHYISTSDPVWAQIYEQMGLVGKFKSMSDPELPTSWILSGYHKFAPKWGTSFSVKYIQWHRFSVFPGKSSWPGLIAKNGRTDVEYRWKDAWTFALGQDYYLNDNWTLRAGLAWDQSPTPSNTYRTNRIPDSDRIWASAGFSYMLGNHEFDFGYAHVFMMHGRVRNNNENDAQYHDLQAKYHNHSNMLAFQYQYKF